jgi:hypothetical protein
MRQKVSFVRSARKIKPSDSGAKFSKMWSKLTLRARNRFLSYCSLLILSMLRIRIHSSTTNAVQSRH